MTKTTTMMTASPLLQAKQIKKNFGGVQALKGVDFYINEKEGLGLVGENGAGKSTLMKILSGVYGHGQFEGDILLEGAKVVFENTKEAEAKGIAIIHQELNLFPELSVGENIFLSHLPVKMMLVDYAKLYDDADAILRRLGVNFSARDRVKDLNTGNQQMVEIAKAISLNAKILILDEPTSSLTLNEIKNLFTLLKKLQEENLSFIYISHKLEEVYEICNRVTVLRDGSSVFESSLNGLERSALIEHMVGREITSLYPKKRVRLEGKDSVDKRESVLEIKNWNAFKMSEKKMRVKNASLTAYRGEILGISGLMGAGRTDLLLSVFGHDNYHATGEIKLEGESVAINTCVDAVARGLALVSEDRKKNGLHLDHSIEDNMMLVSLPQNLRKSGTIDFEKIKKLQNELISKLKIKLHSASSAVKNLSGGNQQKVAIAKWLSISPRVLFLDEPTRGIDVGAKFEIYELLNHLVDEGVCVIIVSSELPEIVGMCDRVLVMREGEFVKELKGDKEVTPEKIMQAALGI